ncbi:MAG TPA: PadR family transcriptional regulator [Pyrinomonadaceae bacterium]|jgi:DNA-binding PadR family transcriptional regulator
MPKKRNITELEGCVLGLIGLKGPCTPYVVRKEFQQSPTPFWSGSAGAIYPLIERLTRQKLIDESSSTDDARGSKLYTLTAEGEKVLKQWLHQPAAPIVIGTPPDPLRNRIEFLAFLTPRQRKSLLAQVKAGLEEHLKDVIRYSQECDQSNYFDYLSLRGAVLAARARLDWIVEITEILEKQKWSA